MNATEQATARQGERLPTAILRYSDPLGAKDPGRARVEILGLDKISMSGLPWNVYNVRVLTVLTPFTSAPTPATGKIMRVAEKHLTHEEVTE